jgi:hypothetical protein
MTSKYNSELSNYDSKLQDSIFWKRKEQFALVMENLVTDSIDREEFQIAFFLLWWENMDKDARFTRDPK